MIPLDMTRLIPLDMTRLILLDMTRLIPLDMTRLIPLNMTRLILVESDSSVCVLVRWRSCIVSCVWTLRRWTSWWLWVSRIRRCVWVWEPVEETWRRPRGSSHRGRRCCSANIFIKHHSLSSRELNMSCCLIRRRRCWRSKSGGRGGNVCRTSTLWWSWASVRETLPEPSIRPEETWTRPTGSEPHTHTHTHTLSHTHTYLFLWIVGTLHRCNGYYTVQTVFSISLHQPYT